MRSTLLSKGLGTGDGPGAGRWWQAKRDGNDRERTGSERVRPRAWGTVGSWREREKNGVDREGSESEGGQTAGRGTRMSWGMD